MAKEQVNIVFSADSAQARKLFEEISSGLDKVGQKTKPATKGFVDLEGALVSTAAKYLSFAAAVQTATKFLNQETEAINKRADAFERIQPGFDKIRAEGGLSAGMADRFRGTIANATQFASVDTATAQGVAQQMLEDRFSPDAIQGGGLNAMLKGIVAINARGEGGDPKNLSKSIANVMQTLGRSPTQGGVESTIADLHGLMNATGMDLGGAEGLLSSMARINTPKKAKILAQRGLTPGQLDVNSLGIGPAGKNLAAALEGMTESEQAAYLSRLIGDEGATAFIRGKAEFASGRVSSAAGDVERDFAIGTTGTSASLRRSRAMREQGLASKGAEDAYYRETVETLKEKYAQGGFLDRAAGLALGVVPEALQKKFADPDAMIMEAHEYRRSLKVEITSQNNVRATGKVRGTQRLAPLNKR